MNKFYNILIHKILNEIIPKTKKSISKGNKIFGAAILKKKDLSTIVIGTNNEIINPLLHGEMSAIIEFFELSKNKKINPRDYIFLSSHEPCSLCLSAITWSGFDNFYYFFPYTHTKNKFNIPHDLNILKEVFKINNGKYNKKNFYWQSHSLLENINKNKIEEKNKINLFVKKIYLEYEKLSNIYQKNKKTNNIILK